jgi:hypothetical protein
MALVLSLTPALLSASGERQEPAPREGESSGLAMPHLIEGEPV